MQSKSIYVACFAFCLHACGSSHANPTAVTSLLPEVLSLSSAKILETLSATKPDLKTIAAVRTSSFSDYYRKLLTTTTDGRFALDGSELGGARTALLAAREHFVALDSSLGQVGALWASPGVPKITLAQMQNGVVEMLQVLHNHGLASETSATDLNADSAWNNLGALLALATVEAKAAAAQPSSLGLLGTNGPTRYKPASTFLNSLEPIPEDDALDPDMSNFNFFYNYYWGGDGDNGL